MSTQREISHILDNILDEMIKQIISISSNNIMLLFGFVSFEVWSCFMCSLAFKLFLRTHLHITIEEKNRMIKKNDS